MAAILKFFAQAHQRSVSRFDLPVQLQRPICPLVVLVLKPGQSAVQLADFLFQPLNVLLALPQKVAAAG